MNKHVLNKIALVVGGVCVGSGTTYLVVNNRLRTKYQTFAEIEISRARAHYKRESEDAKEHYKLLRKEPPYDNPETAFRAYAKRVEELDYDQTQGFPTISDDEDTPTHDQVEAEHQAVRDAEEAAKAGEQFVETLLETAKNAVDHDVLPPSQAQRIITLEDLEKSPSDIAVITGEQEIVTKSIFDMKEPDQETLRDKEFPYLISEEEFHTTEQTTHEKLRLIYYAGDEVPQLAGEDNGLIKNIDRLLGKDSVKRFGYDKNNPTSIFVRNHKRRLDMQVDLEERSYGEAVLGLDPKD